MKSLLALGFLALGTTLANAQNVCVDIKVPKAAIESRGGHWVELTPEQWRFLEGVYVVNPLTPPGLPFGDKAALAQVEGNDGALVFFIDGDRACAPMPIPHELLGMLKDVATGELSHEGGKM